jgi:DNA-binding HxlR family transcriptional regulator
VTAVAQIKGKTEQRVEAVVQVLQDAPVPLGYGELREATGASYDSLLYILATLEEIGRVKRTTVSMGPGRPKVYFEWVM